MKKIILGVDHGYGNMKTSNFTFLNGIEEFDIEPPFPQNVLEFEGKYYVIGEQRQAYQVHKTQDNNYYLLTLAAIAKELKERTIVEAEIVLAVGLPLEYMGVQKDDFKSYLLQNKDIRYKFEGINYYIKIIDAYVFPQGYSCVANRIGYFTGQRLVVDIGSWTVDIIPFNKKMPIQAKCESLSLGVITLIEKLQKEFRRVFNQEVEETLIQEAFIGVNSLPKSYMEIAERTIVQYTEEITKALIQKKYNLEIMPIIYCGGGASLMKLYGKASPELTEYITNVNENAKGYEFLCKALLK
jgi:hypothetical protein